MTPLRRRMSEDMQLRNFASETQRNYIHHVRTYPCHALYALLRKTESAPFQAINPNARGTHQKKQNP
jgi:hypothetical protein